MDAEVDLGRVRKLKVVLTFEITGTEEEAWEIAEGLEEASRKRGYLAANSWVESDPASRSDVLGPEGSDKSSSAMTLERRPDGSIPMSVGPISLGDDDGRSIN